MQKLFKIGLCCGVLSCFTLSLAATVLDKVVAVVNRKVITLYELQEAEQALREGQKDPSTVTRDKVLNHLIEQELMFQAAETKGIVITDEDINAALEKVKTDYKLSSDDALKEALAKEGKTLNQFRDEVRRQLKIAEILGQEVRSKVEVSDAEMQEYYQTRINTPQPTAQALVVRHILLTVPEKADAATEQQVKTKAGQLVQQLRAGADFAEMAKEYSEHDSAQSGGELGTFKPGELAPPFDVAFTLQPGEISDPVRSEKGFHILTVQPKAADAPPSYESLKPQIQNRLFEEKASKRYEEWIEQLKQQTYVEIRQP